MKPLIALFASFIFILFFIFFIYPIFDNIFLPKCIRTYFDGRENWCVKNIKGLGEVHQAMNITIINN